MDVEARDELSEPPALVERHERDVDAEEDDPEEGGCRSTGC